VLTPFERIEADPTTFPSNSSWTPIICPADWHHTEPDTTKQDGASEGALNLAEIGNGPLA
jgi:hypothetical protein